MNKKILATTLIIGATAAFIFSGGCYKYTPVNPNTVSNSFTGRDLTESDRILDNTSILTLRMAQEIAAKNNPTYISAYHAVNAARMMYYQALGQFAPVISANFSMGGSFANYRGPDFYDPSYTNNAYDGANYLNDMSRPLNNRTFSTSTGINAQWLLWDGLARYFQSMAYKHQYNYQANMEDNTRRLLMQAVAMAYNDILLAEARREIALSNYEFQNDNLSSTMQKWKVGSVPLSELLNFQIRIDEAVSSQISAEYERDIAIYSLASLMGYSDGVLPAHLEFENITVNLDEPIAGIDVYLDAALSNRPDLAAYREALEIAKYSLYGTYSSFSPTLSASAGVSFNTTNSQNSSYSYWYPVGITDDRLEYDKIRRGGDRAKYNSTNFSYGLQADWVLFNGGQRFNATRQAQAQLASAEFDLAQQWLGVVQEVRGAYANYAYCVKQARVHNMFLSLVSKQRELVQAEYDNGAVALTRLNEAQTDLVTTEMNLATALIGVQKAKAQLMAAINIDPTGYNLGTRYNEFTVIETRGEAVPFEPANITGENEVQPVEIGEAAAPEAPAQAGSGDIDADIQEMARQ